MIEEGDLLRSDVAHPSRSSLDSSPFRRRYGGRCKLFGRIAEASSAEVQGFGFFFVSRDTHKQHQTFRHFKFASNPTVRISIISTFLIHYHSHWVLIMDTEAII